MIIFVLGKYVITLHNFRADRITGGPGVGKGTQCARLARDLGFQHLSVGEILREEIHQLGSPFASFINESIQNSVIVPAQLIVNLLKVKISTSKLQGRSRFLIDGYPRNIDQAVMFEEEVLLFPSLVPFTKILT